MVERVRGHFLVSVCRVPSCRQSTHRYLQEPASTFRVDVEPKLTPASAILSIGWVTAYQTTPYQFFGGPKASGNHNRTSSSPCPRPQSSSSTIGAQSHDLVLAADPADLSEAL